MGGVRGGDEGVYTVDLLNREGAKGAKDIYKVSLPSLPLCGQFGFGISNGAAQAKPEPADLPNIQSLVCLFSVLIALDMRAD